MKSEKILAKDAEPGKIYVTRGGTTKNANGERVPWGFARIKAIGIIEKNRGNVKYSLFQTPWGTECELPMDYTLYTTTETKIKDTGINKSREKGATIELTFQEAIDQGFEKMGDVEIKQETEESTKRPSSTQQMESKEREQKVFEMLTTPEGDTISNIAAKFGVRYQIINGIVKKLAAQPGYKLIKEDSIRKLVKES